MGASRGGKKPLHTALILVFPASVHDRSTEAGSEAKVLLPVWYSIAGADCRQLDLYNHIRLLCSALFCFVLHRICATFATPTIAATGSVH